LRLLLLRLLPLLLLALSKLAGGRILILIGHLAVLVDLVL